MLTNKSHNMRFTVERNDKLVIFTLKNERLDGEVSANFKAELLILSQFDIDALIIDMSNVQSIDSAGLGALLLAYRQLKDYAIPVVLCGVQDLVMSLLSISQLQNLFEFFDTVDGAVESFEEDISDNFDGDCED